MLFFVKKQQQNEEHVENKETFIFIRARQPWGVLVLLNCLPIHERLDRFCHCITMEAFTPAR